MTQHPYMLFYARVEGRLPPLHQPLPNGLTICHRGPAPSPPKPLRPGTGASAPPGVRGGWRLGGLENKKTHSKGEGEGEVLGRAWG